MIETGFVMMKVAPVVFLAGFAMYPVSAPEDALLRFAAGVTAISIIYLRLLLPVSRRIAVWWGAHIDRFFEEHHDAVDAVARIETRFETVETNICQIGTEVKNLRTDLTVLQRKD